MCKVAVTPICLIIEILNFCSYADKFSFITTNKEYLKLSNNDLIWASIMRNHNETTINKTKSYFKRLFNKNYNVKPKMVLLQREWFGYISDACCYWIHFMENRQDVTIVNFWKGKIYLLKNNKVQTIKFDYCNIDIDSIFINKLNKLIICHRLYDTYIFDASGKFVKQDSFPAKCVLQKNNTNEIFVIKYDYSNVTINVYDLVKKKNIDTFVITRDMIIAAFLYNKFMVCGNIIYMFCDISICAFDMSSRKILYQFVIKPGTYAELIAKSYICPNYEQYWESLFCEEFFWTSTNISIVENRKIYGKIMLTQSQFYNNKIEIIDIITGRYREINVPISYDDTILHYDINDGNLYIIVRYNSMLWMSLYLLKYDFV